MAKVPHVALLIETSRSYGRGLLRGIRRYISAHGPWSVFMESRHLDSQAPPWLKHWRGDGILTRTETQATADAIRETNLPAVELRASRLKHDLPFVGVDNRALGRLVVEHLFDRGFRNFGCFDLDTQDYFEQRRDNFVQTLRHAGYECSVHHAPGHRENPAQWERQQENLARWVTGLPKPVGIMACTDQLGFWLLDACRRAGVAVPEEAAVVGAENDESLCKMASPPLSSVRFNAERIGYEAAGLLDRMMAGEPTPARSIQVEPMGVVTRQSSDVVAINDRLVADALQHIRRHACAGIGVEDVLDAVPLSRSALERRMRRAIGRSPRAEIMRVRLRHVQTLLSETDLPIAIVAEKTGFKHAQYMSAVFKRTFHQTPGDYRTRTRTGDPAPSRTERGPKAAAIDR